MRIGVKSVIIDDLAWSVGLRLVPIYMAAAQLRPPSQCWCSPSVCALAGGIGVGGGALSHLRLPSGFRRGAMGVVRGGDLSAGRCAGAGLAHWTRRAR